MINYYLQTNVQIDGVSYAINKRGDYRVILDVISALNDEELDNQQRAFCALNIFYDWNIPPNPEKAVNEMLLFINCGESDGSKNSKPPIMNWEKDFNMLVAPINKALGCEIRAVEYLHWWTFISGYMEIGECSFSNVVNIRQKKQRGKKLEKWEREFYNENRTKIDLDYKINLDECSESIQEWYSSDW